MDSETINRFNKGYEQIVTKMHLEQKIQLQFNNKQKEILIKLQDKLLDAVEQSNIQEIHLLSASMAHCLEVLQNSHDIFTDLI